MAHWWDDGAVNQSTGRKQKACSHAEVFEYLRELECEIDRELMLLSVREDQSDIVTILRWFVNHRKRLIEKLEDKYGVHDN